MSTGRSSRVKMRARPIDVNKPLSICDTSEREPNEAEIEAAIGPTPGAGGHGGHHSGHTGQGDGMVTTADGGAHIPTPPILVVPSYHDRMNYGKFVQPSFYIKAHQTGGTGLINLLDRYDLLEDDIQWLNKYNAQVKTNKLPPPVISEDDMEKCIDMFEREAGKITLIGVKAETMNIEDKIDPSRIFPCVRAVASTTIHGTIVKAVYDYWIKKRVRLGKALMRQYQEPPPRGNTDPHVAFRLRIEGRRSSKRIPRKEDYSGYEKMGYLKNDFVKILDIIENIQIREQLKRENSLLNAHVFDARLHSTPWAQRLLRDHPVVAQSIASMNALPVPASSQAGAPPPPMPPAIVTATPEQQRLFRLLHSCQPPCTYSRTELEAEGRRRRARAAQASSAQAGTKRSSNLISIPRPRTGTGASAGGADRDRAGGDGAVRDKRDKDRHKSHRRGDGTGMGAMQPLEEEPEEMEVTDEEDLLSEDEEDAKFYQQVEAHVKRMKIERDASDGAGTGSSAVKIEPHGSYASYAAYPTGMNTTPTPTPPSTTLHPPARPIPSGSKVGYINGVVGRGNLIWIECNYQIQSTPTSSTQHALHTHLHAHAPHSHSSSLQHHHPHHSHPMKSSHPSNNMQITVHPPNHHTAAAPSMLTHHGTDLDRSHMHMPAAIKAQ